MNIICKYKNHKEKSMIGYEHKIKYYLPDENAYFN